MVTEAAQPKKKELGEWAVVRPATHPDSAYTKTRALLARVFTFHIRSSLPVIANGACMPANSLSPEGTPFIGKTSLHGVYTENEKGLRLGAGP